MSNPWVKTVRRESGLIELVCKHGVGHPAAGSVHWMELHSHEDMELNGHDSLGLHGCDGCCQTPEWKLADAQEGNRIANEHLVVAQARIRMLQSLLKEK